MFKEKTVLILGAGASCSFGYPTGMELIQEIKKSIKNDCILVPQDLSAYTNIENLFVPLEKRKFDEISFPEDINMNSSLRSKGVIAYKNFSSKKLNQFIDLNELLEALETFNPISIDVFLYHHPKFKTIGKLMIAYNLLKVENKEKFKSNMESSVGSWYTHLIHDIKSGCKNPKEILSNKLSIITFNYDVSLDYYLEDQLLNIPYFKDYAAEFLNKLKVLHVYGKLYNDFKGYGDFCGSNSNYKLKENFLRITEAIKIKENIKLMQERIDFEKEFVLGVKKIVNESSRIIVIGFGFDKDNLEILGFPKNEMEWVSFLNSKKFQYHNYDGKMRNINNQFAALKNNHRLNIMHSDAKTICDAYHYDFRLSILNN